MYSDVMKLEVKKVAGFRLFSKHEVLGRKLEDCQSVTPRAQSLYTVIKSDPYDQQKNQIAILSSLQQTDSKGRL